jgi:O-antigen/teichoic acid export membrane protein
VPNATPLLIVGGLCFGIVIGWITYRTLRRREGATQLSDISTVLAAVGGGAVTALPFEDPDVFGTYAIGLAVGFFGYLLISLRIAGNSEEVSRWMGD